MKIKKVIIRATFEDNGIATIDLERLEEIVILTGRNGSGKSRILEKVRKALAKVDTPNEFGFLELDGEPASLKYISYIPGRLALTDPNNYTKHDLVEYAKRVGELGMSHLAQGVLARIQLSQDRWFSTMHPESHYSTNEKELAAVDYRHVQEVVRRTLGAELERNVDGDATIFGLPIGKAGFSEGQSINLQFGMAALCQGITLEKAIVFLDEPENYLHPSALINTVEELINCVKHGQIWIATHSVPLLARFSKQIWFVENGAVKYAGSKPQLVLEGLLGKDAARSRLRDFLDMPAMFAFNNFSFECLFRPQPVMTDCEDKQMFQIKQELDVLTGGRGQLKLLDYGSGKGRLIANIRDIIQNVTAVREMLDYFAFDPMGSKEDVSDCKFHIQSVYDGEKQRHFTIFGTLHDEHMESFDVVVMCNVLHEIDPLAWPPLFQNVSALLKESGAVLVVEDTLMPIGELAYQKGFIVLETSALRKLFAINDEEFRADVKCNRKDNRFQAHTIPQKFVRRITTDTRIEALKYVQSFSLERIGEIRRSETTYPNGRALAFYTQQFTNATLALNQLQ